MSKAAKGSAEEKENLVKYDLDCLRVELTQWRCVIRNRERLAQHVQQ